MKTHRLAAAAAVLGLAFAHAASAAPCAKQEPPPNGPGVRITENCYREEGNFVDGLLSGKGKFTGYQGAVTEGQFRDGRLNGFGTVTKPATNGRFNLHRGYFEEGDPYGPGMYKYQDDVVANGMFFRGHLEGFGVMRYPNGAKMMGYFHEDEGYGTMLVVYPDGTTQTGEYRKLRYSLLRAGKTAPPGAKGVKK